MSRPHTLLILDPSDTGVHSLINELLAETSLTLDVMSTQKFEKLNDLQAYLIKIYDTIRYQAELTNRTEVFSRVLYNDSYKDKKHYWDAIFINNKQMENKLALQIIDHLQFSEKPIIYLFPTSNSKFILTPTSEDDTSRSYYNTTAVGGTFDHLHDGHKILLSIASFITSSFMIIGVTGALLLQNKKFKEFLQDYNHRLTAVSDFVHFIDPELVFKTYEIDDVCGPTATIEDIDALILSAETHSGGEYVNKVRSDKGWPPLEIHQIDVIGGGSSEDNWADKLSSTKLRELEYIRSIQPER